MKRATTKLIPYSKITTSSTSITGNFTAQFTTSSSSISKSPIQKQCINHNLKPCSNSEGLIYKPYKTRQFHNNPSQNYSTQVGITPYYPSNQSKITKRSQIEEVFESTKSAAEMIAAFKKMKAILGEGDVGLAYMEIAFQLDEEGEDPQKIMSFANQALSVFHNVGNKCSLDIAMILDLLGSANYRLKKFDDALEFLNKAYKILVKLENDGKCAAEDIMPVFDAVQMELSNVLTCMGRNKEAIDLYRKSLEVKKFLMGENSREFGDANRAFAESCVWIKNFKDGLPYCLKALEIHLRLLGEKSVEVGHDRRVLGVIYTGMGEYEKALEENKLAQKIFKNRGCSSDLFRLLIGCVDIHIGFKMYEAAMNTLNGVVQDSENRSRVLVTMGKVLVYQEKFDDAKRCLELACSVLDKKEKSKPLEVSQAYSEIALEYQNMHEFENAISVLKRALALIEKLPDVKDSQANVLSRLGLLLLFTDKVKEAIPYLEGAVESVKETFACKHFVAGYIYNNLGAAYLELERPHSAAQMFVVAKDIMDASSIGPHHNDSIQACQNLSKAYAAMKR